MPRPRFKSLRQAGEPKLSEPHVWKAKLKRSVPSEHASRLEKFHIGLNPGQYYWCLENGKVFIGLRVPLWTCGHTCCRPGHPESDCCNCRWCNENWLDDPNYRPIT